MAKKYPNLSLVLKKLLFEKDMKPVDLAKALQIPPPTIHRLVTGKSTRPYESSLKPIADYFAISIEQLLGENQLPQQKKDKLPTENPLIRQVPLVPIEVITAGKLSDTAEQHEMLPVLGAIGEESFAIVLNDSAMEPIFSRGSILIFDTDKPPIDRSYVLIKLDGIELPIFRQLLIDVDHKYLKALNSDLNDVQMRLLGEKDKIIGTLIESRKSYGV